MSKTIHVHFVNKTKDADRDTSKIEAIRKQLDDIYRKIDALDALNQSVYRSLDEASTFVVRASVSLKKAMDSIQYS